ncbi:hypothetical protein B7494_g7446 [Chlorociboria aeruginascens]|nr:hypothetical protein B7494_g7446 [Chlorociboria aeruginascens]
MDGSSHPYAHFPTGYGELRGILLADFNMPTHRWWTEVNQSFETIRDILCPDNAGNPNLPCIVIVSTGTHALGLTATNEVLECVAFGSLTTNRFLEVFWESIARAQQNGEALVIHEIDELPILRFLFRLGSHTFELRYMQSRDLVRNYNEVTSADSEFLDTCTNEVKKAVQRLQRVQSSMKFLDEYPVHRRAYYFIRAWAVARGLYCPEHGGLSPRDIIRLLQQPPSVPIIPHLADNSDLSAVLCMFYRHHLSCTTLEDIRPSTAAAAAECCSFRPNVINWTGSWLQTVRIELVRMVNEIKGQIGSPVTLVEHRHDWIDILLRLKDEPLRQKMPYPYFIKINVVYIGHSAIKGGKWLSMIYNKLPSLQKAVEDLINPDPYIRLWPHRLVSNNTDPKADIYEGCFILGLDSESLSANIQPIINVCKEWRDDILSNALTVESENFFDIEVTPTNPEIDLLVPCTRVWTRPVLKPDEGTNWPTAHELPGTQPPTPQESASEHSPSDGKRSRLRPAIDVLQRLRHDRRYSIDEYVVGYKDRHNSQIMEKLAADWTSDTTEQDFIPEHRIEYFKQYTEDDKSELVWEKKSRLDRVFSNGRVVDKVIHVR